jgi:DNA-binding PadR family transcriptional regulator
MVTSNGPVGFHYFILGLLAQQPMSGYDIRRFLRGLDWLLGNPSFGVIYPALHVLLKDGLVGVEVMSRPDKPPRKVYSVTSAGVQALQEWVARKATANTEQPRMFLMHLAWIGDFSPAGLVEHLRQRRETVAVHHSALQRTIGELSELDHLGQRLVLEYSLATSGAELAWLDSELAHLSTDLGMDRQKTTT